MNTKQVINDKQEKKTAMNKQLANLQTKRSGKIGQEVHVIFFSLSDCRVALTASISKHFISTNSTMVKTRPQQWELRALLFTMSVRVL